ncbi:MAG: hypothetical protein IJC43_08740 [Clostridia bacterium]|nr:hypothetical protein [Clostridia bacterium]
MESSRPPRRRLMWTALLAVLLLTLALFLPIGPYRLFFESGGLYLHIDRSRQRPSTEAEQRTLQQYLLEPADLPGEGDTVKERLLALSSVTEKTKDFTYYDSAPIEDYFHDFGRISEFFVADASDTLCVCYDTPEGNSVRGTYTEEGCSSLSLYIEESDTYIFQQTVTLPESRSFDDEQSPTAQTWLGFRHGDHVTRLLP